MDRASYAFRRIPPSLHDIELLSRVIENAAQDLIRTRVDADKQLQEVFDQ